jgi:dipeptidase E
MKLMLTSNGLETIKLRKAFSNLLEKKVSEAKVIVVHTASKPEHMLYVDKVGKELSKSGVLHPNITYLNINSGNISPIINYDAVYICGGNTFYILDRIRKTGLDKSIINFVKSGGVYVGVSAGSIIAGKNIDIAGWGSEGDINHINLKDLKGLDLTDIAVYPHYKNRLRREVEDFRQKVDYPVEYLKDKEAIVIKDKKIRRIMRA